MLRLIKKLFVQKEKEKPVNYPLDPLDDEDRDRELLELDLLQDDVCSKHHG